jgi:hypothetical protein
MFIHFGVIFGASVFLTMWVMLIATWSDFKEWADSHSVPTAAKIKLTIGVTYPFWFWWRAGVYAWAAAVVCVWRLRVLMNEAMEELPR